ncbi:MAG: hypothetical protein NT007_08055 [Candidatus Kapabacteria bacterium]|nr:hypothetical protein [Candidatus Kapabacteria bacterium]
MEETKFKLIITVTSFFTSIILSSTLGLIQNSVQWSERILVAGILFIVFNLCHLLYLTQRSLSFKVNQYNLCEVLSDYDKILNNIRTYFLEILDNEIGDKDLFVTHFHNEFIDLQKKTHNVARMQELSLDANHFLNTDNVLNAFSGAVEKDWLFTWPIDNDYELFYPHHWMQYFESAVKLVPDGISEIKAILVLNEEELVDLNGLKHLFHFFKTFHSNIQCKYIVRSVFKDVCTADNFVLNYEDCGLYGNKLLYVNEYYSPETIKGKFIKNKSEIDKFRTIFNRFWNSELTKSNPSQETNKILLKDLFNEVDKLFREHKTNNITSS